MGGSHQNVTVIRQWNFPRFSLQTEGKLRWFASTCYSKVGLSAVADHTVWCCTADKAVCWKLPLSRFGSLAYWPAAPLCLQKLSSEHSAGRGVGPVPCTQHGRARVGTESTLTLEQQLSRFLLFFSKTALCSFSFFILLPKASILSNQRFSSASKSYLPPNSPVLANKQGRPR